jgi:ankyrin repeat protein
MERRDFLRKGLALGVAAMLPGVGLTAQGWIPSTLSVPAVLVDSGTDLLEEVGEFGDTLLHYVAWNGDTEAIKLLIDTGDNLLAKDKWGDTPLHYAAQNDKTEAVKLLIDSGAELMAKNGYGETPLCSARRKGHSEVVQYLVHQQEIRIGQKRFAWGE